MTALRVAVTASPYRDEDLEFVLEAERLGVHSVWSSETWGYDAFTPLAYLAARTATVLLGTAIAQVDARTPAMLAMSALSMQALSRGRFLLGIGSSGPQVMEGWHGVPFRAPVARTRETIEIVRMVARGERLAYEGRAHTLPLPGGQGRALRPAAPPAPVPVYVASLGPANLRMTGEVADGWLGTSFLPEAAEVFLGPLRDGAAAAGRALADLELVAAAALEFSDDVEDVGRRHARGYAFTIGAMGSGSANFYNDAFTRQGFGDDVRAVRRLWADGRRQEAAERVPLELGLRTNLIGPPDLVAERLRRYRDAGITTVRVVPAGDRLDARLAAVGRLLDLVAAVNAEGNAEGTVPAVPPEAAGP